MEKRKSKKLTNLIIDSNVFIAALRSKGLTRSILFSNKLFKRFRLMTLDYCFDEIWKYRDRWDENQLADHELIRILDVFFKDRVKLIRTKEIGNDHVKLAFQIMKDVDIKDIPILALALYLKGNIWSNDKHFKIQKKIQSLDTQELKELIGM